VSDSKSGGIGTVAAVQIVFIINKLTNAGDIGAWSWWWVLSPIWISFLIVVVLGTIGGIAEVIEDRQNKKARAKRLRNL
jgi:hypothetical protein